ncbi:MarR family winged helix-turn-helix transcriptional regulator [Actinokineospora sp.]|uniref:MarR family winged helix-turn-helix transcriptional regulator n=1 Tax=Actinokineospora sp. TaxID=1872133 RepID=UPI0040377C33
MDYAEADAINSGIRSLALRHRARAGELLADLGLYPGQEFLVMDLAENGPRIQSQLATAIHCEPPSITLMVGKLERAGYVRRRPCPQDRRAIVVDLTDNGRTLATTLRQLWIVLAEETVADLPEASVERIAAQLAQLADNLRRGLAARRR